MAYLEVLNDLHPIEVTSIKLSINIVNIYIKFICVRVLLFVVLAYISQFFLLFTFRLISNSWNNLFLSKQAITISSTIYGFLITEGKISS